MSMIDIHCHILPGIDDGAADLQTALEMAQMASESGVTDLVATPHFHEPEQLEPIRQQYAQFAKSLRQAQIPLRVWPGAEVLCLPDTPRMAADGLLPTLGQGNYVLAEFYFNESFAYMDQMLTDIADCGYRVVVAHPERYGAIQYDPLRLRRWATQGYVLQLNKGSILGKFGSRAQIAANAILEMGLAHLIASDAHGSRSRTPHMTTLETWVQENCDENYGDILLYENPRRIILGKDIL